VKTLKVGSALQSKLEGAAKALVVAIATATACTAMAEESISSHDGFPGDILRSYSNDFERGLHRLELASGLANNKGLNVVYFDGRARARLGALLSDEVDLGDDKQIVVVGDGYDASIIKHLLAKGNFIVHLPGSNAKLTNRAFNDLDNGYETSPSAKAMDPPTQVMDAEEESVNRVHGYFFHPDPANSALFTGESLTLEASIANAVMWAVDASMKSVSVDKASTAKSGRWNPVPTRTRRKECDSGTINVTIRTSKYSLIENNKNLWDIRWELQTVPNWSIGKWAALRVYNEASIGDFIYDPNGVVNVMDYKPHTTQSGTNITASLTAGFPWGISGTGAVSYTIPDVTINDRSNGRFLKWDHNLTYVTPISKFTSVFKPGAIVETPVMNNFQYANTEFYGFSARKVVTSGLNVGTFTMQCQMRYNPLLD